MCFSFANGIDDEDTETKGGDTILDTETDDIDHENYKGIYFDDESAEKYQSPRSGAHFNFINMWDKLHQIKNEQRKSEEREIKLDSFDLERYVPKYDDKQSRNNNGIKHSQTENKENVNKNILKAESFAHHCYNDNFRNECGQLSDLRRALESKQKKVWRNRALADINGLQSFPTVDEGFKTKVVLVIFSFY